VERLLKAGPLGALASEDDEVVGWAAVDFRRVLMRLSLP
jgi:hypothetical protein